MKWDTTRWYEVKDPEGFWRWIAEGTKLGTRSYLFIHNVGFDFPVTRGLYWLPRLGYELVNFIIDDPPTMFEFLSCPENCTQLSYQERKKLRCKSKHRKITILDTLNFFRMSLKALGDYIGSSKLDMPRLANGDQAPFTPEYAARWEAYNKQDVQVMIDAMRHFMEFVSKHDLGSFAITQASQSFMAYRHRFMPENSILIDANERGLAIARNAYAGGRVDVFRIGKVEGGPFYKLDINSMYPGVMRNLEYPSKLIAAWRSVSLGEYADRLRGRYKYSAECEIVTDEPAYAYRNSGRLDFPVGRFVAHLSTPEIDYAHDKGHLKKIRRIAIYEKETLFRDYVDYFYTLRMAAKEEGNEVESFFLKILMNSLYGKFGQNGRKWKTETANAEDESCGSWVDIDFDTGETTSRRKVGAVVQYLEKSDESMNSHPAIAGHVTAEARMQLWHLIVQAGRSNVFYCDTDSLFVNQEGRDRLRDRIDPDRLGALKVEDETDHLVLRGLKDYEFGKTIRIKGVRDPHNPVAPDEYKLLQFRGLKGAVRADDMNRVIITSGTKKLTRNYSKGTILASGVVEPHEINEI